MWVTIWLLGGGFWNISIKNGELIWESPYFSESDGFTVAIALINNITVEETIETKHTTRRYRTSLVFEEYKFERTSRIVKYEKIYYLTFLFINNLKLNIYKVADDDILDWSKYPGNECELDIIKFISSLKECGIEVKKITKNIDTT